MAGFAFRGAVGHKLVSGGAVKAASTTEEGKALGREKAQEGFGACSA